MDTIPGAHLDALEVPAKTLAVFFEKICFLNEIAFRFRAHFFHELVHGVGEAPAASLYIM